MRADRLTCADFLAAVREAQQRQIAAQEDLERTIVYAWRQGASYRVLGEVLNVSYMTAARIVRRHVRAAA